MKKNGKNGKKLELTGQLLEQRDQHGHRQLGPEPAPEDHRPARGGSRAATTGGRRRRCRVGGGADVVKLGGDVLDPAHAAEHPQGLLLLPAGGEGVGGVRKEEAAEGEDDGRDCCVKVGEDESGEAKKERVLVSFFFSSTSREET